jgi:dTDP-4-dehydrorhamnose reductase
MILVTGASGLLGANLVMAARKRGEKVAVAYHRHPVRFPGTEGMALDLNQPSRIEAVLDAVRPDWIVHCAAATDVDWCQDNPEEARRINTEASRRLAESARARGTRFLFVSTDAVFDGRKGGYGEGDSAAPVNVYGSTKWAAEQAIQELIPKSLVVRTNLYGWNLQPKQNLAEWILNRLEASERVPGFEDVIFTPILADDLSELLLDMIERSLEGLYHVTGSEALSKYEFARRLAKVFGHDPGAVQPIRQLASELRAPRPRNTALRTTKAARALGRDLPTVSAGLQRFKADRESGYVKELQSYRGA